MSSRRCFWILVLACVAQAAADTSKPDPEFWFPVGEKLTYKIYWGKIPVGETVATTSWDEFEGQRVLAVRFRTKTNKILSKLYPVDDFIESLIDPETFLPVRFTKKLSEGRYRCDEVTHFDHKEGKAHFKSLLKDRSKVYDIDDQTRDLITFMYYVRGQVGKFETGNEEELKVMADEKIYDLLVTPAGIEDVKLSKFGKVQAVRFEPEAVFEGLFVRKGKLWLWVSDDDRRIVVKGQARVPVASIKIQIAKVEGPGDDFWTQERPEEPRKKRRRKTRR